MNAYYPHLFTPICVGNTVFRNRIFGAPHYGGVPFPGSNRHDMHIETLAEEARGGAAQVTIGDTMVDPVYGIQPWEPMVASQPLDSMYLGECAAAIRQFGAKAFIELDHPGQFALVPQPVGPDFLIEYRISGDEHVEGGLKPEMTGEFLRYLEPYIDMVNVSGALECDPMLTTTVIPSIYQPYGTHLEAAAIIKKMLTIPVIAVGAIQTPERAEEIIASGRADAVMLGRPLMADPFLPEKARTGRQDDIAPCTRCLCCLGESETKKTFNCSVNPTFLRQYRLRYEYIQKPERRRVLVVGGGFGGMKAAVTAAERGHEVILAEKGPALGGMLSFTDHDHDKKDLRAHKDHLIHQVAKHDIRVLLNTEITKENAGEYSPDVIIVAVGSEPVVPPIPGIDLPHVSHVLDMYPKIDELGRRIVVIGGGLAGVEPAIELAHRGHEVTVLEALKGYKAPYTGEIEAARSRWAGELDRLCHTAYGEGYVPEINDANAASADRFAKDLQADLTQTAVLGAINQAIDPRLRLSARLGGAAG